jgi:hypothetical protein
MRKIFVCCAITGKFRNFEFTALEPLKLSQQQKNIHSITLFPPHESQITRTIHFICIKKEEAMKRERGWKND